jgi:N utilization substance protein B
MLNRRHIREKVMKTLYAYFQSKNNQVVIGEKELFHSIDKVYEVYLYYMALMPEIKHFAEGFLFDRSQKMLPTDEDLNPKLNFVNNRIISAISDHSELSQRCTKHKISWDGHEEMIKKLYYNFKDDLQFRAYLEAETTGFDEDKEIIMHLMETFIFPSESLQEFFEERSIYWLDDIHVMQTGILKTIKGIKQDSSEPFKLQPLHKEAELDRKFASDLFRLTILKGDEFEKEIARRTQNWEIDRVAKMDVILMKMALCELTEFTSIPIKVTLDEYIELSKDYSSPQSKTFINGILDKIVIDFKKDKRIAKAGRGLVE